MNEFLDTKYSIRVADFIQPLDRADIVYTDMGDKLYILIGGLIYIRDIVKIGGSRYVRPF